MLSLFKDVKICLTNYGFGLGCNVMGGPEQKHQMIVKILKR